MSNYDELIKSCIKALSLYNEKIETPDSFLDNFLLKVNNNIYIIIITYIDNKRSKFNFIY